MNVGLLGAGRMASAFAVRLVEAGHRVQVWNRTREKAEKLERAGAAIALTPRAAARGADVLVSMLADDRAIEEVVLSGTDAAAAGIGEGGVHVSMSTISPSFSERLERMHRERGQHYIAAPVIGRPEAAASGELVVVTGGPEAALARCAPVFAALAKQTRSVGDVPARANAVKLAVNFILSSMVETLGEAFAFAGAFGVEDDALLDILNDSVLRSPAFAAYAERIAHSAFEPAGFRLKLGLKDVRLALDAAETCSVAMPVASVVRDRFVEAMALGLANSDWSAVARAGRH